MLGRLALAVLCSQLFGGNLALDEATATPTVDAAQRGRRVRVSAVHVISLVLLSSALF